MYNGTFDWNNPTASPTTAAFLNTLFVGGKNPLRCNKLDRSKRATPLELHASMHTRVAYFARCLAKFEYIRNVISKYPVCIERSRGKPLEKPSSTHRVSIYSRVYSNARQKKVVTVLVRHLGVFSRASSSQHVGVGEKLRKWPRGFHDFQRSGFLFVRWNDREAGGQRFRSLFRPTLPSAWTVSLISRQTCLP